MKDDAVLTQLDSSVQRCRTSISALLRGGGLASLSDDDLIEATRIVESLENAADAARAAAAAEVRARCLPTNPDGRLDLRCGARSAHDLLTRITGASTGAVSRRFKSGDHMRVPRTLAGEALPGRLPLLRAAREEGLMGSDTADAILTAFTPRAAAHALSEVAERTIVAMALGITAGADHDCANDDEPSDGPDTASPAGETDIPELSVDDLRAMATHDPLRTRIILPTDTVKRAAMMWARTLDPDGAAPDEGSQIRKRSFMLTPTRNGLVRIHGYLLPDVGAQLRTLLDALTHPRATDAHAPDFVEAVDDELLDPMSHRGNTREPNGMTGPVGTGRIAEAHATADCNAPPSSTEHGASAASHGPGASDHGTVSSPEPADFGTDLPDLSGADAHPNARRSTPQKLHDAFASLLSRAAALPSMPLLQGSAPTLVVTISADDLERPHAVAALNGAPDGQWHDRVATIPASTALSPACDSVVERIRTGRNGAILGIESKARLFTPYQRRVIAARDGGCIIPGCTVGPAWCEVHHVHAYAEGGTTTTDNGVLLCWYHHRFLSRLTWRIRMRNGVPEVRPPGIPRGRGPLDTGSDLDHPTAPRSPCQPPQGHRRPHPPLTAPNHAHTRISACTRPDPGESAAHPTGRRTRRRYALHRSTTRTNPHLLTCRRQPHTSAPTASGGFQCSISKRSSASMKQSCALRQVSAR